jgi:YidC/Oxa1 family membrane protein insertase
MSYFFHLILYKPLLNLLILIYQTVAFYDLGVAVIFLTIFIRLVLLPLFHKGMKQQAKIQKVQPEIKRLRELHKGNREAETKALLELYKEHDISPFGGILVLLIQIPIFITLYQISLAGLSTVNPQDVYSFIVAPPAFHTFFLGLINLQEPSILIVGFGALAQLIQGLMATPSQAGNNPQAKTGRQMAFIAPVIIFFVFRNLPATVALYLLSSTLFSIVQQYIVNRSVHKQEIKP